MPVGLTQTLAFGVATLALWPIGGELQEKWRPGCSGLGKLFWTPRYRLTLYGRGLVS